MEEEEEEDDDDDEGMIVGKRLLNIKCVLIISVAFV
jgi:hypothetical protein